jgi:DnaB-like helicase N terminal domain/AAA domain
MNSSWERRRKQLPDRLPDISMNVAPQNLEAEHYILGAILTAGAVGQEVSRGVIADVRAAGLAREHFYFEKHALTYDACLRLDGADKPTDVTLVADDLERTHTLEDAGGWTQLHEWAALAPATANAVHYAGVVIQKARRRDELAAAHNLEHASLNGGLDADEALRAELATLLGLTAAVEADAAPEGLRTRGVILERVRPIRWLWDRRLPMGLPSLIIGEEGIGKGTLAAWIIARATCGQLDGDLHGEPVRVLIIGDEDAFEPIWVPRLWAAGADLTKLRTLDDSEYLDDLKADADRLAVTIQQEEIGLLLLDQLLDHVSGGAHGEAIYNPKAVREAMKPLRRVAGEQGIAALGLLHPIKGNVSSFRQLIAGSHQFNAVSRSSLLLGVDPDDEARRLLVRGKGNHSAAPRSFEFTIVAEGVELNQYAFEVPRVAGEGEGDRTIQDLLKPSAAPVREALKEELAPLLTDKPQTRADLARAVGRDAKDGSVGNALKGLEGEGRAEKVDGGWVRAKVQEGAARMVESPGEGAVQPLRELHRTPSAATGAAE